MNRIYFLATIAALSALMIFTMISCFGMGSYEDDPEEWPYAGDEFDPVEDDDDAQDDDVTEDDDDDQVDDDDTATDDDDVVDDDDFVDDDDTTF